MPILLDVEDMKGNNTKCNFGQKVSLESDFEYLIT
jgi:hypothetical protein